MDRATRKIIWNQLEILSQLNPGNSKQYEIQQEIVASGYTSRYETLFANMSEHEADALMQKEVIEVLDMFRALNIAKDRGWAPSNPGRASFKGFDGNNESHYHFAHHILDEAGLYAESAPNKNSHGTMTMADYAPMISQWQTAADRFALTDIEAEAIIA